MYLAPAVTGVSLCSSARDIWIVFYSFVYFRVAFVLGVCWFSCSTLLHYWGAAEYNSSVLRTPSANHNVYGFGADQIPRYGSRTDGIPAAIPVHEQNIIRIPSARIVGIPVLPTPLLTSLTPKSPTVRPQAVQLHTSPHTPSI
jgi:hypothetical protein